MSSLLVVKFVSREEKPSLQSFSTGFENNCRSSRNDTAMDVNQIRRYHVQRKRLYRTATAMKVSRLLLALASFLTSWPCTGAFQPRRPPFAKSVHVSSNSARKTIRDRIARRAIARNIATRPKTYTSRPKTALLAVPAISVPAPGTFYMILLAVQFASQPLLTKRYAPPTIIRSTYVLAQDLFRMFTCVTLLIITGSWHSATASWKWSSAAVAAGLPALLYAVQNYCSLVAYQNLPPITYNVLNQTKTLSAAVCCYFLLRQRQSPYQIVALGVLLVAALVMESILPLPGIGKPQDPTLAGTATEKHKDHTASIDTDQKGVHWASGVLPVLAASGISGLAGALAQKSLQVQERNSFLFSGELAAISAVSLLISSLLGSPDGRRIRKEGWTKGWTWQTWIPLATNAAGGILVGLVTKHAGSVRKGFALIIGMFLSGVLQNVVGSERQVTSQQWAGGSLAALSLWLYTAYPMV
ncbi:predicted protein [Phaeodactylum tricornutum CCAP 1055/1]|uniref:Uncharacterized protein n=1 Tax=Phaeodactylum tricornutum (strain CCAP 1055/1) TaxID=556484 RepID=B7GC26_PHATC|nr:predicted protein [Phaeodactylum tricornutum CCAP 1055/1]EEC43702.1 predicted protein [Phaeodactylum tricornutum CCAP 1055/1]|eukprot:XP_002184643.1 predicted protein [Phaeodactylum tricornutum CCAP 1055/1]